MFDVGISVFQEYHQQTLSTHANSSLSSTTRESLHVAVATTYPTDSQHPTFHLAYVTITLFLSLPLLPLQYNMFRITTI